MNAFVIDLGAPFYWAFLVLAVLVLTPVTRRAPRSAALAALNLLFITLLTASWGGAAAAAYAMVMHGIASLVQSTGARRARQAALVAGGSMLLALFLVHKLSAAAHEDLHRSPLVTLLGAVGFSYVALRTAERLRAGADRVGGAASWLDTVSYLFPFHMLAAGPIQSWEAFHRHHGISEPLRSLEVLDAIDRIVHGLFKKFVVARLIELTLLTRFTGTWPYQLLEVQAYYLWVYLDFSAYSDLAVGAGKLLGVVTPENFDRPLSARNIIVFWERWHITLASFVRRNVFIPLQLALMRRANGAHPIRIASVSFAVSFVLVGLWHAVSLRFLLWGAMHAGALICCMMYQRMILPRLGRKGLESYLASRVFRVCASVLTFEFVAFSLAFLVHPALAFLD